MSDLPQSAEDYVEYALQSLRAPRKTKTLFTRAGRQRVRQQGERLLYGPDGRPIKVVTDAAGNTTVATDKIQAVHVRPQVIRTGASVQRTQ